MSQTISAEFPFESRYLNVKGSKIHYIDEGQGDPMLFLHGNPTSSYLWRNIIPKLSGQARCIAPDLIGMGKSDQPDLKYGFLDSYAYLEDFIEKMNLDDITLVVHDWGSGLGFHYAHRHPKRIKGIAFMEAVYRRIDWGKLPSRLRFGMSMMRSRLGNYLLVGLGNAFIRQMLPNATMRKLRPEEMRVYAQPYPTLRSRRPLRVWPREIAVNGKPRHTWDIIGAYHEWLKETQIPKLCLYGDPGILIGMDEIDWIKNNFPNTETAFVGKGLHFIQEDQPHAIGRAISSWYENL